MRNDCVNVSGCLKYLEMTQDPESEVIHCDDCPAYSSVLESDVIRAREHQPTPEECAKCRAEHKKTVDFWYKRSKKLESTRE